MSDKRDQPPEQNALFTKQKNPTSDFSLRHNSPPSSFFVAATSRDVNDLDNIYSNNTDTNSNNNSDNNSDKNNDNNSDKYPTKASLNRTDTEATDKSEYEEPLQYSAFSKNCQWCGVVACGDVCGSCDVCGCCDMCGCCGVVTCGVLYVGCVVELMW